MAKHPTRKDIRKPKTGVRAIERHAKTDKCPDCLRKYKFKLKRRAPANKEE